MTALKKVRIWRPVPDGMEPAIVDAGPTPVPGLAVIYYPWGTGPRWEVLHEASGFSVANADGPEHALAIAVALGDCGDWTRPASALQRELGLREAVVWRVERSGGHFWGPLATREVVAAAEASSGGAP